ncbi:hypothetical protein PC9H_001992 [Pleurotus ostreatus]|uniref:Protein kinase domain-containing protein n=1 Tax=Pleurotus ostreatus TaxID=5322 RepID=A0A8H6ZKS5_PLEOS|nr:uncharacterized protein PC9H_001992 [Pleurotus ostreatus]KAF7419402.1 hypothetical protein PC9H_001992 [Pleurotus ostreatus]
MRSRYLCRPCVDFGSMDDSIRTTRPTDMKDDFMVLVSGQPVKWGPSSTFWTRVAQLPPVEYFAGSWTVWEDMDVPAPVANADANYVSVFIVPQQQYDDLNEERDILTGLREAQPGFQSTDTPSTGAHPSAFRARKSPDAFEFNRPKPVDHYPIPISLLQPEFGRFKRDVRTITPDPRLSPLGWRLAVELSSLFKTEDLRESCLHRLLAELFGGDVALEKRSVGSYKTDGGVVHVSLPNLPTMPIFIEVKNETTCGSSDAVFELLLYYKEGVRHVLSRDFPHKGDWVKTRFPSILIMHNGPNIQVYGGVWLLKGYVEVISHSLPLHFNEFDTEAIEDLLRFMTALRGLFESLCEVYRNPQNHVVDGTQIEFPYPRSYVANVPQDSTSATGKTIQFTYTKRISPIRLVFAARTDGDGEDIIIKFGFGKYGAETHKAAAAAGIAPALLSYSDLPGGIWMVVMRPLPAQFKSCLHVEDFSEPCQAVIKAAVDRLHDSGHVHGDLRDSNVWIANDGDRWDCQIIDYDWAGVVGDVRYPLGVFISEGVWRPRAHMDGDLITLSDDSATLSEFLNRKTILSRF